MFATIQLRLQTFKKGLLFLVMDKITEQLPMIKLDNNNFKIPQQLQLADPSYHTPGNINILLGVYILKSSMQRTDSSLTKIISSSKDSIRMDYFRNYGTSIQGQHENVLRDVC